MLFLQLSWFNQGNMHHNHHQTARHTHKHTHSFDWNRHYGQVNSFKMITLYTLVSSLINHTWAVLCCRYCYWGFFYSNQKIFFILCYCYCVYDTLVKDSKWQLVVCVRYFNRAVCRDKTYTIHRSYLIWHLCDVNEYMSMDSKCSTTIEHTALWIRNRMWHQNQDLKIEVTSSWVTAVQPNQNNLESKHLCAVCCTFRCFFHTHLCFVWKSKVILLCPCIIFRDVIGMKRTKKTDTRTQWTSKNSLYWVMFTVHFFTVVIVNE